MIELRGKYNTAKVFTDNVEETAMSQIIELCNQEFIQGSKIRIMPDTHAGAGCVIGTTMTIKDKIVPNLVGVDIGCGMAIINLGKGVKINLEKLDNFIRENVPSGHDVNDKEDIFKPIKNLKCKSYVNQNRALCSLGTLGGGNHFIEVDIDNEDNTYIVIHSGSRYLGKQVAEYYQEKAFKDLTNNAEQIKQLVDKLKSEGRERDIQNEIKKIKKPSISRTLAYVEGKNFNDYLNDMEIVQQYACINRQKMLMKMFQDFLQLDIRCNDGYFQTIHNYIDLKNMVLRKGSISAQKDEIVLIPINMRDGSLLCKGKGNSDWNYSAPHGAGRLMSRSKAKELVTIQEFENSMVGIYTTSVNQFTIDESPMAYKPMQEIIDNIQDTVEILKVIKPIYNFKAGE